MPIEKETTGFAIHAGASADAQSALKIEQHDGEFTVTVNIDGTSIVATCSADNLQSREKFTGTRRVGEDSIAIRRDDATLYQKFSHATVADVLALLVP